jgi:iron complex transport system ATP-binding protein
MTTGPAAKRATIVLDARNVGVALGNKTIIDDASLTVGQGEFVVLVGPNGAGKTTLVRALAGLLPCTGAIRLDGQALTELPLRTRARSIAYLPQGHVFYWPMRVDSVVALGREPHADPFRQSSEADRVAIRRAMQATAIEAFADRSIDSLSGGEKARVAIARALATEASLLIADEPTASLDVRHQLNVMALLQRVAHEGTAVLAIVHDLALAMRFADRVIVIDRGRVVADGPPGNALTPSRIAEVFGVSVDRIETSDGPLLIPSHALPVNH